MPDQLDEIRRNLALLDLRPGSTWEEVRDRYRFLAKVWHPDRFGSDAKAISRAEAQFKRVNDAYQWLVAHRHLVESLASRHGAGAEPERPGDADAPGSPDVRAEDRADPGSHPKPESVPRLTREWSLERFLWGVIAAFSLVALTILVASGTISDMLDGLDPAPETSQTVTETARSASRAAGGTGVVSSRFVTASRLYVRSSPTRSAPAVAVLERGERVRVRSGSGPWLEVVDGAGDRVGWLHGDYVADHLAGSGSASGTAAGNRAPEPLDMDAAFATIARSVGDPPRTEPAPAGNPESEAEDVDLIRGAWKPVDPDPAARRARQQASSVADPDLEHWSGGVEGPVPSDLPRLSVRLYDDPTADRSIGAVVYWHPEGSCTYSLQLVEEREAWVRTRQIPRVAGCAPAGEVWFRVGDSEMIGIWHRPDGRRWFTTRLGRD